MVSVHILHTNKRYYYYYITLDATVSNDVTVLQVNKNRHVLGRIVSLTSLLGKLSLPFRGHSDDLAAENKGLFREILEFAAEGDMRLSEHLASAPGNFAQTFSMFKIDHNHMRIFNVPLTA